MATGQVMESYLLKISSRESGSLLQNKTFVPIDGPFLSITNTTPYKTVNFVRATWSKCGSKVAACDCHGNIFVFNFKKKRFFLAYHLTICSTFLVFSSNREILIALADCNIVALNLDSKSVINNFNFHTSCVSCISFDKSGCTVLSASKDEAILWDLATFDILRVLTLKKSVDIVKAFFAPDKDIIISAFKDSSIFLWDSKSFNCVNQFVCNVGNDFLNLKTVSCSWDGKLIACAGKGNWFIIWNVPEDKKLHTVSLPQNASVKHISFFPSLANSLVDKYIINLLTSNSEICIYSVQNMELLHTFKSCDNKIITYVNSPTSFQLCTVAFQGNLDIYDVEPFLVHTTKEEFSHPVCKSIPSVTVNKKMKAKDKKKSGINRDSLKSMLKRFQEYPEKYRFFIWSQLLGLPHNVDAFKVLYQESLMHSSIVKDYSFINPGVQKTFTRIMSMLSCWFPVIKEVEYFQCVAFPFIKVLHKYTIICLEILITYISNWCQNWFLFCPFPPFNILCAVENIITYHDPELMYHFIKHDITQEIYAWSLLQTSFSEVFNKHQWLKLWDNIFSNPLSYLLFVVAAFNIIMRDILLCCQNVKEIKQCYRKHGISASVLVQKSYELQKLSPPEISPQQVIGCFSHLPKGAYPSFMKLSKMKVDLQNHDRKTVIDQEIDYLKQLNIADIKSNYLLELQKLQILRRKILLENFDTQDSDALDALARKLKNIQALIQENLTDQLSMLQGKLEYNFASGTKGDPAHLFKFEDYMKKLNN